MGHKNILVIDDELLIRDLLYDFFSEKDWGVSVFDASDKALEMLRNRQYDIALIDINSKEGTGLDLVRKLRSLYPKMPIVVMTAFPSVDSAVDALRLKLDDYIIKPFNANKLYKRLDELVNENRKRAEEAEIEPYSPERF